MNRGELISMLIISTVKLDVSLQLAFRRVSWRCMELVDEYQKGVKRDCGHINVGLECQNLVIDEDIYYLNDLLYRQCLDCYESQPRKYIVVTRRSFGDIEYAIGFANSEQIPYVEIVRNYGGKACFVEAVVFLRKHMIGYSDDGIVKKRKKRRRK